MATERVGDMTIEELRTLIREVIREELQNYGFIDDDEEFWKKPLSELTAIDMLLRERRRRGLP